MSLFNRKIKEIERKNEINEITIERLLKTIFCDEKLDDEEIDILCEQYPAQMNKVLVKNNLKSKTSAKIGFKLE